MENEFQSLSYKIGATGNISRKRIKANHPVLFFNGNNLVQIEFHKYLGMLLDIKLSLLNHFKTVFEKTNKKLGHFRKLQLVLARSSLLVIYKLFVRPHLDYGDIIYNQSYNTTFHQKMEAVQYNAGLTITGAIKASSKEKQYLELSLETLLTKAMFKKLCYFYKILKINSLSYLHKLVPVPLRSYRTRQCDKIPLINVKHNFFRHSFFPSSLFGWNDLETDVNANNCKII